MENKDNKCKNSYYQANKKNYKKCSENIILIFREKEKEKIYYNYYYERKKLLNQLINCLEELEKVFINNLKWEGRKWQIST